MLPFPPSACDSVSILAELRIVSIHAELLAVLVSPDYLVELYVDGDDLFECALAKWLYIADPLPSRRIACVCASRVFADFSVATS